MKWGGCVCVRERESEREGERERLCTCVYVCVQAYLCVFYSLFATVKCLLSKAQ